MDTQPVSPDPVSVPTTLPVAPPAPQRVGPYMVLETLGQGGMGRVLLAEDADGRKVALKLLAPWASDVDARRFEREAELLASLQHENVVGFVGHGVDPDSGDPFIALELVAGRDLESALMARPAAQPMLQEEAVFVLERVARALTAVHAVGIVHRDVKPANVLITAEGQVKLTDFGIALPRERTRVTAPDEIVGTVHYLAPEVLQSDQAASPAADMYALGALAWRLFTGEPLWGDRPVHDVLVAHVREAPPPLATRCPELAPDVAALVDRLLAKAPEDRPSAAQVAEQLAPKRPHTGLIARLWSAEEAAQRRRTIGERLRDAEPVTLQQYRIERELGRGGMGVVYLAYHLGLKRPVALKTMLSGALASDDERRRFLKEAESAATLVHPNIVRVLDAGQAGETCFLAMEYVPGRPLSHVMREQPRDLRRLLRLVMGICEGVQHAHEHGIIHRDLKPENILVDEAGIPRVLDFGMAKRLNDAASVALTSAGAIIGTVHYMPPEQAAGRSAHADARSDVWSIGAVLYEVLTGTTPFVGSTQDVLVHIAQEDPPPPSARAKDVPWELEAIVMKALEREPARRYRSALELKEDLERYLANRPIAARRASAPYRAVKWAARHRHLLPLAGLALLLVALSSGWFAWERWRREQARRESAAATAVDGLRRLASGDAAGAAAAFDRARAALAADEQLALPLAPSEATSLVPDGSSVDDVDARRLTRWAGLAEARRVADAARKLAVGARLALEGGRLEDAVEALVRAAVLAPAEPEVLAARKAALARCRVVARAAVDRALDLPVERLDARAARHDEARAARARAARVGARDALAGTRARLDDERTLLERDQARARLAEEAAQRRRELERGIEVKVPSRPSVADGEDAARVAVHVKDGDGRPRGGCPVRFEPQGPARVLDPEATTDARGEAFAHLVSTVAGVTTVDVTVVIGDDEVRVSQRPRVTFRAGLPDGRASTLAALKPEATADGAAVVTFSLTIRDRTGNPVPGARVELSATGRGNVVNAPGPTGPDGAALLTLASSVAEVKTITATAIVPDGEVRLESAVLVRFMAAAADAATTTVSASPAALVADAAQVSTITVCVRDAQGNPVVGQVVKLDATGSGNRLTQPSRPTGEDGLAVGLLASSVAEVKTVTVVVNPGSHQLTVPRATLIEFAPGPLDPRTSSLEVTVDERGGAQSVVFSARDALGNPIPGLRVELGGTGDAAGDPSGVTDARGEVRRALTRRDPSEVRATAFTVSGPVRFTLRGASDD